MVNVYCYQSSFLSQLRHPLIKYCKVFSNYQTELLYYCVIKHCACSAADISRTEARDALLEYVAQNYCYGKDAAQKMQMVRVKPSNAFHVSI